tara:strand:- start:329 stop:511 length:183 start_codon:yes stop_codon:yes gene_type:complete
VSVFGRLMVFLYGWKHTTASLAIGFVKMKMVVLTINYKCYYYSIEIFLANPDNLIANENG